MVVSYSDDVHQIANTVCDSLGDVDMILCGSNYIESHVKDKEMIPNNYYAVCIVSPAGCILSRRGLIHGGLRDPLESLIISCVFYKLQNHIYGAVVIQLP